MIPKVQFFFQFFLPVPLSERALYCAVGMADTSTFYFLPIDENRAFAVLLLLL
jgi:hypothetical protein